MFITWLLPIPSLCCSSLEVFLSLILGVSWTWQLWPREGNPDQCDRCTRSHNYKWTSYDQMHIYLIVFGCSGSISQKDAIGTLGETIFNFFYWSIVDLQCVNFCCTAKWFSYTCIYILFHILFHDGVSQDTEYSALCNSRFSLVIYFIHSINSIYMSIDYMYIC